MIFKNIEIEKFGQSCFLISNDKRIYFDPFKTKEDEADIVLISHPHYDHCSIEDLRKIVRDGTIVVCPVGCSSKLTKIDRKIKIQVLEPWNDMEIERIKIKAVPAYNFDKEYHPKDENWNGYVIDFSDVKIYHAGDTDLIPEMRKVGKVDIALLPVSGTYVMTAEEAAKAAVIIKPNIAIPMHYGDVVGTKEDALKFKDLCENEVDVRVL